MRTSRLFRQTACVAAMFLYILTKYLLIGFLPAKWFGDSSRLIDMANDVVEGKGSYAATAAVFSLVPLPILNLLVTLIGCAFIYMAFRSALTWIATGIIILLLLMSVPQTLLVPNKESIVIAMTIALVYLSDKVGNNGRFIAILVAYLAYGILVRNYYILILLVWFALKLFGRADPLLKVSFALVAVAALLLLPVDIMQQMQGQRDASNKWALYVLNADNRTAFFNPFPPNSLVNFLLNYGYSVALLNFPFIKFVSFKELIFSFILLGCFIGIIRGIKTGGRAQDFSLLFLAHLIVLCTFEPDLGSYFRHFTSVTCYLFPAFAALGGPMKRARMRRDAEMVQRPG